MFLSKFWNLILVIAIAMLLSVIYLVPSSINESQVGNIRALIVKDRLQLESILKMEARSRLDTTIIFSVDQVIREQLSAASKRKESGQIPMEIKEKMLSQMRMLNDKLTTFKADILIAVDRDGIVIAQVGENERSSGYGLKGFPVVQAALRGYLRDDSWFFGGKLYRMSARPVIHGGVYVGAIIHGQKMDKDFAGLLSRATESHVGIFVEDHIIAVAVPKVEKAKDNEEDNKEKKKGKKDKGKVEEEEEESIFATDAEINTILMGEVFKDNAFIEKGKSDVILSKDRYFVIAIKMVGEARQNNAGVILIRKVPRFGGISDFLGSINKDELTSVPWWKIAAVAVTFLILGILLIYLEGDRPKSRFLKEVEKMVAKEGERLNIYLFRGKYRKLADTINRAIDKAVQVLVSKATSDAPSVSKILGAAPKDDRLSTPAFDTHGQISLDDIPPPPPGGVQEKAPMEKARSRKRRTPTVPLISGPGHQAQAKVALPTPASMTPAQPQAKPHPKLTPRPASVAPAPQPAPEPARPKPAPPAPGAPLQPGAIAAWGGGLDEEETRIYEGDQGPLPSVPSDLSVQPRPSPVAQPKPAPAAPPVKQAPDDFFKQIFNEFYKTKVACGENIENLTFERFNATLSKQEDAIRERTKCRRVEFRVYVKNGKAALKASPIK